MRHKHVLDHEGGLITVPKPDCCMASGAELRCPSFSGGSDSDYRLQTDIPVHCCRLVPGGVCGVSR